MTSPERIARLESLKRDLQSPSEANVSARARIAVGDDGVDGLLPPPAPPPITSEVTLEAIGQLFDTKLIPLNESLNRILGDLNQFKKSVREEFDTIGMKMTIVEDFNSKMSARVSCLEDEIKQMKLTTFSASALDQGSTRNNTIVVGNLPGEATNTFEAAQGWVKKHCDQHGLAHFQTTDMYCKTNFVGLVFVKCGSPTDKDKLLSSITEVAKPTAHLKTKNLFAKPDQPMDIRMAESCLLRMKRMLGDWGYNKTCIKVEGDFSKTLSVAGKIIVKAVVQDYKLVLQWTDGEWESWQDLQSSQELSTIKEEVQGKLTAAKEMGLTKGKGKNSQK